MKRLTDKRLQFWFNRYNKRYFSSRLTGSVRFKKMGTDMGWCRRDDGARPFLKTKDGWQIGGARPAVKIRLSKQYRKLVKVTLVTLLHEMVHADLPMTAWHGPRFDKEMLRLHKAGALKGLL